MQAALVAAALLCSLSGCLSAVVQEKRIGRRADRLEYERAVRSGERLFLFYCFRRGPERCDPKWSAVDLTRITWSTLAAQGPILERGSVRLSIEDGPPPTIAPETAVEIPMIELAAKKNSIGYPGGPSAAELLSTSAGRPLSVYRVGTYSLFLVSRERGARGETVFVQAINPVRGYLTWWAIPARTSLYAVTIPIDVVAFPGELLAIWLVAQGLAE